MRLTGNSREYPIIGGFTFIAKRGMCMKPEDLNRLNEVEKLAVELVKQALSEKEQMIAEARIEAEKILKSAEQRVSVFEWKERENLKEKAEREIGSFHDNSNEQVGKLRRISEGRAEKAARAVFDELRKRQD